MCRISIQSGKSSKNRDVTIWWNSPEKPVRLPLRAAPSCVTSVWRLMRASQVTIPPPNYSAGQFRKNHEAGDSVIELWRAVDVDGREAFSLPVVCKSQSAGGNSGALASAACLPDCPNQGSLFNQ